MRRRSKPHKSGGSAFELRPLRKLPVGDLRGRYLFSSAALDAAERLLPTYRGPDGDHEGIVFLLGRELPGVTIFAAALAPEADHSRGRVMCDAGTISAAQGAARNLGLGLLGQVHSHPSGETEHSEGDDDLVLMPFEGMLSLVVPHYGRFGMRPLWNLGVHQFQDGGWVRIRTQSARDAISLFPAEIDLR